MLDRRLRKPLGKARNAGRAALVELVPQAMLGYVFRNPLFDRRWYLRRYPDVARQRMDAERHYRRHGVREGRNPNELFHTRWYMDTYPEAAAARVNPLDHFLIHGSSGDFDPSREFDSSWYMDANPDVSRSGMNPLDHYLRYGVREGRATMGRGAHRSAAPGRSSHAGRGVVGTFVDQLSRIVIGNLVDALPADTPIAVVIGDTYPQESANAPEASTLAAIKAFIGNGYHVVFLAGSDQAADDRARARLASLGVTTPSSVLRRPVPALLERLGNRVDVVVLAGTDGGGRFLEDAHQYCRRARVVFLPDPRHSAQDRLARYAQMASREREIYLARMADATIVANHDHLLDLRGAAPGSHVAATSAGDGGEVLAGVLGEIGPAT